MTERPLLIRLLVNCARQLAKDEILSDPTDNGILTAVLDYWFNDQYVDLTPEEQSAIIRAYDRAAGKPDRCFVITEEGLATFS